MAKPYVMLGVTAMAADTDDEARRLFTSTQQSFIALRTGNPGPLPPPVADLESTLDPQARFLLAGTLKHAIVGSAATVHAGLTDFARRNGADELIITSSAYDQTAPGYARSRSSRGAAPDLALAA